MPPKAKAIELPPNFKLLSDEEKFHFYLKNSDDTSNLDELVKEIGDFDYQTLNVEIIPEEIESPDEDAGPILPHPIETLLQACVRIGDRQNSFNWLLSKGADPSIYPPNQPTVFHLIVESNECQQYLETLVKYWGRSQEPENVSQQNNEEDEDAEETSQWNRENFLPTLNLPHPQHGKTPILTTLKKKDHTSTSILLELGAQFNFNSSSLFDNGSNDEPLFHYAIRVGDALLVECLWNCGISPCSKDKKRKTLLHVAVEHEKKDMVEWLQKKMVKIPEEIVNSENIYGNTIVDLCLESDQIELLKLLTSKLGADINHISSRDGLKCIHRAVLNGKNQIVEQLITTFKVKPSEIDKFGNTPLHYASIRGDSALTKLLIDKKAEAPIPNTIDGSLPIHYASFNGAIEIIQMLLADKKADVNVLNTKKESPIHIASSQGHTTIVNLLLERKEINIELEDINGYTPLERAINNGQQEIANILIVKGANFNRTYKSEIDASERIEGKNFTFNTLFLQVVSHNFCLVANAMIQSGKVNETIINCTDSLGRTPFYTAVLNNNIDMAKILLQHTELNINIEEPLNAFTPLILCCKLGYYEMAKLIVENNGEIDKTSNEGKVALHYAATIPNIDLLELLLGHGTKVDPVDHQGRTPLFDACKVNNTHAVVYLLKNQANIEHEDAHGFRPLHTAVQNKSADAVEILCKEGSILNAVDHAGRTPLIVGSQNGSVSCTPILARYFKTRQVKST